MSGYVFLDKGIDGRFHVATKDNEITDNTDLVAYSFFKGKEQRGQQAGTGW